MKNRIILGFLISLTFGFGQFPKNGFPIATNPNDDTEPRIAALGNDFVVVYKNWVPGTGPKLRAARMSRDAREKMWDVWVADDSSSEEAHQIVVDKYGMIWVVFERTREYPPVIGLQKLGSGGEKLLGKEGIDISSDPKKKKDPQLCISEDGLYCAWRDHRSGQANVYLAKISPEGEKKWEAPVCSLDNERGRPNLVSSNNGILVFWTEKRNDTLGIFGNRVVGDNFQWGRDGKLLLPYSYGLGSLILPDLPPQYTMTDQAGGAYIFPAHYGVTEVQRVDSLGNLLFDSIPPVAIPYSIASTEDYGVVGCYPLSGDPGVLYQHVKIVKIDSSGARPWGPSFRVWTSPIMDTTWYHDPYCSVIGDYRGGCVVAIGGWQSKEERDMIVVHVDSSGDVGKSIIICDAPQDQQNPVIIQNHSTKGYFLVWEDARSGNWDIYGMALDSLLRPGIEERKVSKPVSLLLHSTPNPFSKPLAIRFQLPVKTSVSLKVYDMSGRGVKILAKAQNLEPGTYTLKWDGRDDKGQLLSSGVYFIRFKVEDYSKTQKVILFR